MKRYVLLIREDLSNLRTEEALEEKIKLHLGWITELKKQDIFINGMALNEKSCFISKSNKTFNKSIMPYPDCGISGVYFIQASGFDDAVKIAEQCPVLNIGDKVEVRELF